MVILAELEGSKEERDMQKILKSQWVLALCVLPVNSRRAVSTVADSVMQCTCPRLSLSAGSLFFSIYIFRVSFNIIPSREINQLKVYRLSSSNKPRFLFFALCLSSAMLAEQKRRSFLEILQMQLLFPSFKTAINTQNIYTSRHYLLPSI